MARSDDVDKVGAKRRWQMLIPNLILIGQAEEVWGRDKQATLFRLRDGRENRVPQAKLGLKYRLCAPRRWWLRSIVRRVVDEFRNFRYASQPSPKKGGIVSAYRVLGWTNIPCYREGPRTAARSHPVTPPAVHLIRVIERTTRFKICESSRAPPTSERRDSRRSGNGSTSPHF
jgi:hypothetical protein